MTGKAVLHVSGNITFTTLVHVVSKPQTMLNVPCREPGSSSVKAVLFLL